jgi:hypothetical protein
MNKTTDGSQNFGEFINAAGEHFRIRGLSPLLPEKIRAAVVKQFPQPPCPTYDVTTAAGDTETHLHDETTLIVDGDAEQTKQNQAAWKVYATRKAVVDGEYNARLMRAVFNAVMADPTQDWRDEMGAVGIEIPADKAAEKYLFVETRVVQSAKDIATLMMCVFRLAGVISEEKAAEAEATFQRSLEAAFASVTPPG